MNYIRFSKSIKRNNEKDIAGTLTTVLHPQILKFNFLLHLDFQNYYIPQFELPFQLRINCHSNRY